MLGGNRSGKTFGGKSEAQAHAYGYRYWEVPGITLINGDLPPRESIDRKYWVTRSDGVPIRLPNEGMAVTGLNRERGIGQILFPAIEENLPVAVRKHREYRVMRGPHGHGSAIFLPASGPTKGSKFYFGSNEQDEISFEGFILDWLWGDEPIRKKIYNGLWARLTDYFGNLWFTLTPLGANAAWLYNDLYLKKPDDLDVFEVSQDDNPFLTEEMKRAFREGGEYDSATEAARLYGRFQLLGNRAIPEFNPDIQVVDDFLTKPEWIHVLAVDPHHRRPAFMVWLAYDPHSDTFYVIREWPTGDFFKMTSGAKTPVEYARIIRELERNRRSEVRICDPRFGKSHFTIKGQVMTSFVEDMAEQGADMIFDANVPDIERIEIGLQRIRDRCKYDTAYPISPTNRPRLYIFRSCTNTIKAFLNLGYLDHGDETKGLSEKLSDEFKDPLDCVRYAILYPLPTSQAAFDKMQVYSERDLQDYQELI